MRLSNNPVYIVEGGGDNVGNMKDIIVALITASGPFLGALVTFLVYRKSKGNFKSTGPVLLTKYRKGQPIYTRENRS